MKMIAPAVLHARLPRPLSWCFGALIAAALTPAWANIDEHKVACTAAQTALAKTAVAEAKKALATASASFKSGTDADQQLKWFGALNSNTAQGVMKVYDASLGAAAFSVFWCPVKNDLDFKWELGDLAAVHKTAPGAIFLTPDFFKLKTTGIDSQMGTIVHELTHIVGIGLHPEVYGTTKTKELAAKDGARARANSDNFQYFLEELFFKMK